MTIDDYPPYHDYVWNFASDKLHYWINREKHLGVGDIIPFEYMTVDMLKYIIENFKFNIKYLENYYSQYIEDIKNLKAQYNHFLEVDIFKIPQQIRFMAL